MNGDSKLKFNFLIVNREIEKKLIKFLNRKGYNKYFLFYGKGSANSSILEYLGIGETENTILVFPLNEKNSIMLFEDITNSEFIKHTIAFRIPIKGISSKKSLDYFLKEVIKGE